jgi:hypothetical protein
VIAFETLAALALGELGPAEAAAAEEHVLGCDECAAVLERLLDLDDGVREVTRAAQVDDLASPALVGRLERDGLVTRVYAAAAGATLACTVAPGDRYSAMRFTVDLGGVERVDVEHVLPHRTWRQQDVPFDPATGEIVFARAAKALLPLPTSTKTIRILSVEATGDRVLAELVLEHTAATT